MQSKRIPDLRFKGFSGDWEKKKLGNIVDRVVRKNENLESNLPLTISSQYGLVDQITFFNNRIASHNVSNYYLILNGEFAYNKSSSDGFPFGVVKRLDLYKKGVLSTLYIVFSIKNIMITNSNFLTVFFSTDRWYKDVQKRATEGARNHGLLNISVESFFEINLSLPKKEIEQQKIGDYFTKLDNLITLTQQKLEKLKIYKQAMLDKMFPKSGQKVPELRFKGFSGDWEQLTLEECGTAFTGLSGKAKSDFGHGKGRYITYMNVFSNPIISNQMLESIEIDHNQNSVKIGDVFFTVSSEIPEEVGMASVLNEELVDTYLNSFCFGYRPNYNFDNYFLAAFLRSKNFRYQMKLLAQGVSRYNISKKKVMNIKILIPKKSEQQKIGDYFTKLDNLITLTQQKLGKLKTYKQAMLDKMFI